MLQTGQIARYLARLGLDDLGPASLEGLRELHRAHVHTVPYEVVDINLGRPTSARSLDSVERVLQGRGGYCVQLNGAFSELLRALGYDVTWHCGAVRTGPGPAVQPSPPHLSVTVWLDNQRWLVDVGLGDGLYEPVPLRPATIRSGPFVFTISTAPPGHSGWSFDHDARGSIRGIDIDASPAPPGIFDDWHPFLVTSPASRLTRVVTTMRRDADRSFALAGCRLRTISATGSTEQEITTSGDWFATLAEVFGLDLGDVSAAERADLWSKVWARHESWRARRRQS